MPVSEAKRGLKFRLAPGGPCDRFPFFPDVQLFPAHLLWSGGGGGGGIVHLYISVPSSFCFSILYN